MVCVALDDPWRLVRVWFYGSVVLLLLLLLDVLHSSLRLMNFKMHHEHSLLNMRQQCEPLILLCMAAED